MSDELWHRATESIRESRRLMREAEDIRRNGANLRHDLADTLDEMRTFGAQATAYLHRDAARPGAAPARRL
ncbi:hypothetical protein [Methylobacterium radiodurans]|uniref:Uncharacterized protein n=1 Tax=Methylobacterium radiodurans TaxID=2202828 RepID=A0A2U8VRV8_9HYPH|nr:hypothetical protein [Methylobacterium radiodurans]AWN36012.1 hypothetical protein DK427_09965 [Methylobacterium radiodurans]